METVVINKTIAVSDLTPEQIEVATSRYNIIAPIIANVPGITISGVADEVGLNRRTIHRWLERYLENASLTSLVKSDNPRNSAKPQLAAEVESIIKTVIEKRYLHTQKLSIAKISQEVAIECRLAGHEVPHYNTVRHRIQKIGEEQLLTRRQHANVARNRFKPIEGSFPGADHPLAAVQLDHTPLDILVVDDVYREAVGKPWITMAIDVYSRMIIGFYISLDPPGALGTGLCLSHAILPKNLWLTELEVAGNWPVYGVMRSLHMDNAREFRGKMLERACQEYGIEINFRPVATPNYGGHIERLLGTVLREIHTLPGTTFSNTKDRKYYDAEGKAALTLKELEKWLATYIVGVYHQRMHSAIGTTPLAKYQEGIHGSDTQIGIGLSKPIANELKLKLDFMPFVERSVQRYGVSINSIWYYHDILRKWIHSYDNPTAKYKSLRKFAFKRDPRDISGVYFYDPELKDYYLIPYRNTSFPSITIWEHKRIMRDLKERGISQVDENAIFETYARLQEIEAKATGTTAATRRRRNRTRKRHATGSSIKTTFIDKRAEDIEAEHGLDFSKIFLPFEDLEG